MNDTIQGCDPKACVQAVIRHAELADYHPATACYSHGETSIHDSKIHVTKPTPDTTESKFINTLMDRKETWVRYYTPRPRSPPRAYGYLMEAAQETPTKTVNIPRSIHPISLLHHLHNTQRIIVRPRCMQWKSTSAISTARLPATIRAAALVESASHASATASSKNRVPCNTRA